MSSLRAFFSTLLSLPATIPFRTPRYRGLTASRIAHLRALDLPLQGRDVLDVSASVGDFAEFYASRGCTVSFTEVRPTLLSYLRRRFPDCRIYRWNLEDPQAPRPPVHEVVHCYGLIYHVKDPATTIRLLAENCSSLLTIESRVLFGDEPKLVPTEECWFSPTEAYSGHGNRPTRSWIRNELLKHFPYVYFPVIQPDHPEFPTDWTKKSRQQYTRVIVFASRTPLNNPLLTDGLPQTQRVAV